MQSVYAVILFDGGSMLGPINIVSTPASRAGRAQTFYVWMFGAYRITQIKKYARKLPKNGCIKWANDIYKLSPCSI